MLVKISLINLNFGKKMKYKLLMISPFLLFSLNASDVNASYENNITILKDEYSLIKPIAIEEAPSIVVIVPDTDGDGVLDDTDQCLNTPKSVRVDKLGCEVKFDTDKDSVTDADDECPGTLRGIIVDDDGCELDSDGDGIVDSEDQCPNTGADFSVDGYGCPQVATIHLNFATNDFSVTDEIIDQLADFAQFLKDNRGYDLIIYGFTDDVGSEEDNLILSKNRAMVAKSVLMRYGVQESRMTTVGKGESEHVADNNTEEGRARNRRIEVELIQ